MRWATSRAEPTLVERPPLVGIARQPLLESLLHVMGDLVDQAVAFLVMSEDKRKRRQASRASRSPGLLDRHLVRRLHGERRSALSRQMEERPQQGQDLVEVGAPELAAVALLEDAR